jgi:CTP synthase
MRHRHRYEINPEYVDQLADSDFIFSGVNPKTNLVEIAELKNHPFYLGVQYHPEFSTTTIDSNPLFDAFIKAVAKTA